MTVKQIIKNCLPYGIYTRLFMESSEEIATSPISAPEVYSENGDKMIWIYFQAEVNGQIRRSLSNRLPKYIVWDAFDYGLPIHVYRHQAIYNTKGNPKKKFAYLVEGKEIMPDFYRCIEENLDILKQFDAVFTIHKDLIDKIDNGYYVMGWTPWYGGAVHGGTLDPERYKRKTKNISIISSDKEFCRLHKYRKNLAFQCKANGMVDTFGTFDGGNYVKCPEYLEDYRFHIAIENEISRGYITQKILDCFLTMTIPIYLGAPDIGDYFNLDGIIVIDELNEEEFDKVISDCTVNEYNKRIDAIIDNYNRVQKYMCVEDFMLEEYGELFERD